MSRSDYLEKSRKYKGFHYLDCHGFTYVVTT